MAEKDNELNFDDLLMYKSALVLRAINNKLCLQILKLIHKEKRISVTDLYKELNMEQSVASRYLAILRNADFVRAEREGKNIFYSLNYIKLEAVQKSIKNFLNS